MSKPLWPLCASRAEQELGTHNLLWFQVTEGGRLGVSVPYPIPSLGAHRKPPGAMLNIVRNRRERSLAYSVRLGAIMGENINFPCLKLPF